MVRAALGRQTTAGDRPRLHSGVVAGSMGAWRRREPGRRAMPGDATGDRPVQQGSAASARGMAPHNHPC